MQSSNTISIQYTKSVISYNSVSKYNITLDELLQIDNNMELLSNRVVIPEKINFNGTKKDEITKAISSLITPKLKIIITKCDIDRLQDIDFSMVCELNIKNCPNLTELCETLHNVELLKIHNCKNLYDASGLKTANKMVELEIANCNKLGSENIYIPNSIKKLSITNCSKIKNINLDNHYNIVSVSINSKAKTDNTYVIIHTNAYSSIIIDNCTNVEFIGEAAKLISLFTKCKNIYLPKSVDVLKLYNMCKHDSISSKYDVCNITNIDYSPNTIVTFTNNIKLNNNLNVSNTYKSTEVIELLELHPESSYNLYFEPDYNNLDINVKDTTNGIQNIYIKNASINITGTLNIHGDTFVIKNLSYTFTYNIIPYNIQDIPIITCNINSVNKLKLLVIDNIAIYHKHALSNIIARTLAPSYDDNYNIINTNAFMASDSIVKLVNCVKEPLTLYLDPNVAVYIIYDNNITAIKPCPNLPKDTKYRLRTIILGVNNDSSEHIRIGISCKTKSSEYRNFYNIGVDSKRKIYTNNTNESQKEKYIPYIELPNNCYMLKPYINSIDTPNTNVDKPNNTDSEAITNDIIDISKKYNCDDIIYRGLIIDNGTINNINLVNPMGYNVTYGTTVKEAISEFIFNIPNL